MEKKEVGTFITLAEADTMTKTKDAKVVIPTLTGVEAAKDWVDNENQK